MGLCFFTLVVFTICNLKAQGTIEFQFQNKTYTLNDCYAVLVKESKGTYKIDIYGKGNGVKNLYILLYDEMSALPPLKSNDPVMSLTTYTNAKNATDGAMFNFNIDDMNAWTSDWKLTPEFTIKLTKLDAKAKLVSGEFTGPVVSYIANGKQEKISNGKFTNLPLKQSK